jgi:signal peptidase I
MKKFLKELYPYVIIVVVVILIRTFIATPVVVNGPSMETTLYNGEILILNKLSKTIGELERFDIVVVNDTKDNELIIKRIIGLPGDKVEYIDNKLYINEELIEDDYAYGQTDSFDISDICVASGNKKSNCDYDTVPQGYYLVLGDNREVSYDSRKLGFIKEEDIKGTTSLRIWPLTKIGLVK